MADSMLWSESTLWTAVWQTSLVLAFGLLSSLVWSRWPAKAHRIVILAVIASLFVPALTLVVRELDLGLLAQTAGEQPTALVPSVDIDTAAPRLSRRRLPSFQRRLKAQRVRCWSKRSHPP